MMKDKFEKIEQNFKVGVLKELHRRQHITAQELEKAIKALKKQ